MKIYLASTSPRRRMLLKKLGLNFQLIEPKYNEVLDENLDPVEYVKRNALNKLKSVLNEINEGIIISADTIVVKDGKVLEKPVDFADAYRMLEILSGTSHFVYTAIVVLQKDTDEMELEVEKTKVIMRELEKEEIKKYIDSNEPFDAAGGYKIQERGALFVTRIEGCFSNVIGLPIATLVKILKKFNVEI